MTLLRLRLAAFLVPIALLAGALAFEYLGGLYPCEMCMWQRWPLVAALILASCAFDAKDQRAAIVLTYLAAMAIAVSGTIGVVHAGVEYKLWQGFTSCSTELGANGGDMLDAIMHAPITRCDTAPWTLAGISMAGYNAIISLGTAITIVTGLKMARN